MENKNFGDSSSSENCSGASYNISIITSPGTDNLASTTSGTSPTISNSSSLKKPTYAAVLAKSLRATVVKCTSATASSSSPANESEPMAEGLKPMTSESSKGLTHGSSSQQLLQGTESPPSPSEKQASSDETTVSTSCRPELTSENHNDPPTPARDSYNISIVITSLRTDILPSKSETSSINSSSKPTYAAVVVAKSLTLPVATVAECSSATTPLSLPANESEPMAEGLKLMASESCKGWTDGSSTSLLKLQGSQRPPFPLEKQVISDETRQQEPTSQNGASLSGSYGQLQSATHGATSATGSHISSLSHNRPRRTRISGYGSMIHNVVPHQRGINQNSNTTRSFHGRNINMPHRGRPTMVARPPPPPPLPPLSPPSPASYSYPYYLPQSPVPPPYGVSVSYGFPDLGSHVPYHATPAPPPFIGSPYVPSIRHYPMNVLAPVVLDLHAKIVKQIDYYFSFDNLVKDIYLRKQMDREGWIPIRIIAGFPRIKKLTRNVQIITDALQTSSIVEISDNKIRLRVDWMKWILDDSFRIS